MITLKVHLSRSFLQGDTDTPGCNLFLEAALRETVGQKQFETNVTLAFDF